MNVQNRWTYHDLSRLPTDINRYELWGGELIITHAPTMRHQEIVRRLMKLFVLLDPDDKAGRLYAGASDVVLGENWVYQPDLFFITAERLSIIKPRYVEGAPDLCIDILAPTTTTWSTNRRRKVYEQFGVQEYWLINPFDEHMGIWARDDQQQMTLRGEYQQSQIAPSAIVEGLSVGVSALFEDLPDFPDEFDGLERNA